MPKFEDPTEFIKNKKPVPKKAKAKFDLIEKADLALADLTSGGDVPTIIIPKTGTPSWLKPISVMTSSSTSSYTPMWYIDPVASDSSLLSKQTKKSKPKKAEVMEQTSQDLNTAVFGRTHNPFTGLKETLVFPDQHPLASKVMDELGKATTPVEVEATPAKITVRPLRRTAQAAVRIALDLLATGAITNAQAYNSVPVRQLLKLMTASVADFTGLTVVGAGLAAAPGIVAGCVALTAGDAITLAATGKKVVLMVDQTTPEDMDALKAVVGVIAKNGGYTSHSAVVARQMGKPCIVGYVASTPVAAEASVTIDGNNGKLYVGEATITQTGVSDETKKFIALATQLAKLQVFANADTDTDVKAAIDAGAQGIGLCRTEHTFFTPAGIAAIRDVILTSADGADSYIKNKALQAFSQVQRYHFDKFFLASKTLPVTIRLLDPPMHEFLPSIDDKEQIAAMAKRLKIKQADVKASILALHEQNPMLGHRGCRLGITLKGLYEAQVESILFAAITYLRDKDQVNRHQMHIGIMVPLIVSTAEMKQISVGINAKISYMMSNVAGSLQKYLNITIGTMLETPRSCLIAYDLADSCQFFSFGTNDLTQTTWALSRDDSKFMAEYKTRGIVSVDPFESLDIEGVGVLMDHAVASLKDRRSNVKIGICGEHGGNAESIAFCHKLKLDYVSCAPTRVSQALLAAASAAVAGEVAQDLQVQEIELEPIVQLKKEETQAPVVAGAIKFDTETSTSEPSGKDYTKFNTALGLWVDTAIPKFKLDFKSFDAATLSPGKIEFYYVKYHTPNGAHEIGLFSNEQLLLLGKGGAVKSFVNPTGLKITSGDICAIAIAQNAIFPAKLKSAIGNATESVIANVLSEIVPPAAVPEAPKQYSLSELKKLPSEDVAKKLNGMFVKYGTLWCKVIGYAPNPFKMNVLAVQLPAGDSKSDAFDGPLKKFNVLLTKVDEAVLKTKLKYIKLDHITEILPIVIGWS